MTTKDSAIFTGIYGIPEAARYLAITPPLTNGNKVSTARLRYWIRTSIPQIKEPVFPTRQRLITFLDLISMRMVAVLRSRNIKLREIRNTEAWLLKEFGIQYPLASHGFWTCDSHIFLKFEEHILLTASKFGQQAMTFIKDWLREVELDMTFDAEELANSWLIYKGIRINPKIQFGEPCIDGTRIPISSLWSNFQAGDKPETIAKGYELSVSQVQYAIQWEQRLVTT